MKIFVCIDTDGAARERLSRIAQGCELHLRACFADDAPLDPVFADCEICLGNPPRAWLEQRHALRWIQLESVGFGEYLGLARPPLMTNLAGFFAEPVAETALAGILAHYRGLDRLIRLQDRAEWQGDALRPALKTLQGARVTLFGRGAINATLGRILKAFDCQIEAFGRDWRGTDLDRALRSSDIIVSAVPDTPETRGVFDQARLGLMPEGAVFVSLGRGSVVDEAALVQALESGRLGGAVIDVTLAEPLVGEHAFWRCRNVILTQHTGGGSADETMRKLERFETNLVRYRTGREMIGVVDFKRGY